MTRSHDLLRRFSRAGLRTGGPRVAAIGAIACLCAACSLPISIPLGPLAAVSDPDIVTGSIAETDAPVEDEGISEQIGANAWAALRNVLASAAERGEDGQAFSWKSDNAEVEGTVTAVNAFFDENGVVCRRMAITASAYQRTDIFAADACRRDAGGWNVRPVSDGR